MLAFRVEGDGEQVAVAGAEDWSVLSLIVSASRSEASERLFSHADASIGGLTCRDTDSLRHHIRWGDRDLKMGSRVVVTLIETDSPTAPIKRYRSDAEVQESPYTETEWREMRRRDYLELKKEFGAECG